MSALKHMEPIFGRRAGGRRCRRRVAGQHGHGQRRHEPPPGPAMPVVVVKAKRMTAQEKRQSAAADAAVGSAAKGHLTPYFALALHVGAHRRR